MIVCKDEKCQRVVMPAYKCFTLELAACSAQIWQAGFKSRYRQLWRLTVLPAPLCPTIKVKGL